MGPTYHCDFDGDGGAGGGECKEFHVADDKDEVAEIADFDLEAERTWCRW